MPVAYKWKASSYSALPYVMDTIKNFKESLWTFIINELKIFQNNLCYWLLIFYVPCSDAIFVSLSITSVCSDKG